MGAISWVKKSIPIDWIEVKTLVRLFCWSPQMILNCRCQEVEFNYEDACPHQGQSFFHSLFQVFFCHFCPCQEFHKNCHSWVKSRVLWCWLFESRVTCKGIMCFSRRVIDRWAQNHLSINAWEELGGACHNKNNIKRHISSINTLVSPSRTSATSVSTK